MQNSPSSEPSSQSGCPSHSDRKSIDVILSVHVNMCSGGFVKGLPGFKKKKNYPSFWVFPKKDLQFFSSVSSMPPSDLGQSFSPSHFQPRGMHCPLSSHFISVSEQLAWGQSGGSSSPCGQSLRPLHFSCHGTQLPSEHFTSVKKHAPEESKKIRTQCSAVRRSTSSRGYNLIPIINARHLDSPFSP